MAPYGTAADRKKIMPLERFKCRICGAFKGKTFFSNKEVDKYRYSYSMGNRPTAESANLRCQACSGEQALEITCKGPCGLKKPLDAFSKNTRKNQRYWCEVCTKWKDALEPGISTGPAPNNERAPGENTDDDELHAWEEDDYGQEWEYETSTMGPNSWFSQQAAEPDTWGPSTKTGPSGAPAPARSTVSGHSVVQTLLSNLSVSGQSRASTQANAASTRSPNPSNSPFQNNRYVPSGSVAGDGWSTASNRSSTVTASPAKRNNGWAKPVGARTVPAHLAGRPPSPPSPPPATPTTRSERIRGLYNEDDEDSEDDE